MDGSRMDGIADRTVGTAEERAAEAALALAEAEPGQGAADSPDADAARLAAGERARILATPELVLDDPEVMRALVTGCDRARGENVIDLRGMAMERLEARLDKLEDTHRFVIATAYENLSGAQLIQRAVLRLMEPGDPAAFLATLEDELAGMLRLDRIRLVIEGEGNAPFRAVPPGFAETYVLAGRRGPMRAATLRHVPEGAEPLYGEDALDLGSEALLRLEIGGGRHAGLLALASRDPGHFQPSHGTDLLAFLAASVERLVQRWLP